MTFDELKTQFRTFLENSTVNLGRKTAKTRKEFIEKAIYLLESFVASQEADTSDDCQDVCTDHETCPNDLKESKSPMGGSVLCIKPKDKNRALDVGKGVHSMTGNESGLADEQLGRSPFGKGKNSE